MRGALVGFGQVAENAHAPAWRAASGVEIAAVCEARPDRREAAKRAFPGARIVSTLKELEKVAGLDFADVATPPHLHAEQASALLSSGLHVLCEKPLVLDSQDLERLAKLAARKKRTLFAVHNWKHAPLLAKLKALVAQGAVGRPRHFEWHVLRTKPAAVAAHDGTNWRTDSALSGGGILMDHGWHAVYLAAWLLDEAPVRAAGTLLRPKGRGAEDEATCLLEFPSASAVIHLSWRSDARGHQGLLFGEGGRVEISDDALSVVVGGKPEARFHFAEKLSAGSAHPDWFAGSVADFRCSLDSAEIRAQNLLEARACARMIESIYRAHE